MPNFPKNNEISLYDTGDLIKNLYLSSSGGSDPATATNQVTEIDNLQAIFQQAQQIVTELQNIISNGGQGLASQALQFSLASNATLNQVLSKLINNPSTDSLQISGNASLSSILSKLINNPSTDSLQISGNASLSSILSKLINNPSTDSLQTVGNAFLSAIALKNQIFSTGSSSVALNASFTVDRGDYSNGTYFVITSFVGTSIVVEISIDNISFVTQACTACASNSVLGSIVANGGYIPETSNTMASRLPRYVRFRSVASTFTVNYKIN